MSTQSQPASPSDRRKFVERLTNGAMFAGLFAAYGTLAAIMTRYLYPSRPSPRGWMFVSSVSRFALGDSLVFTTPSGESVSIARQGDGSSASDFVALSSVCPHLGCQVHWEGQNNRFFCPCHNGVFAPDGVATSGPPADAGQSLLEYPLKVDGQLLFIEVRLNGVAMGPGRLDEPGGPPAPGHDPCLYARRSGDEVPRT